MAVPGRLGTAAAHGTVLVCAVASLVLGAAPAATAGEGTVGDVTPVDDGVQVLFSVPALPDGAVPDLDTVTATVDGEPVDAEATLASDTSAVERVAVLAIDTSDSMAGEPFDSARGAALAFAEQAPDDVRIGLVSFAGEAVVVEEPTTDREALADAVAELEVTRYTRLYDGIRTALDALGAGVGTEGSLLVLSDGRDTSGEAVDGTLGKIRRSGARVDVVALGQSGSALATLGSVARAGDGEVTNTDDPEALEALFDAQARVLDSQLLVTVDLPAELSGRDADLGVTVQADGETWSDSAFVRLPEVAETPAAENSADEPLPALEPLISVPRPVLVGGLGGLALGVVLLVGMLTGAFTGRAKKDVKDRLAPYSTSGPGAHAAAEETGVVTKAVEATDRLIKGGGLDTKLAKRLEAAGMQLHAAEWLLLHAAIAVGSAAVGFAFWGIAGIAAGLSAGARLPWMFVKHKEKRRIKAFESQLADTLQLIAGSLSAGLSLTQSLDTVVRDGSEPIAGEFRRALIEQRLGVEIEEALDGIAGRMKSDDFAWIVMAIRIQREVGGNLAELLLTVAGTLRERDYLRRQVKTLSAEGRMSAWILGGLPIGFFIYLMLLRPEYLAPMLDQTLGLLMLGAAGVLMVLGVVTMKQMVKVEV